MPPALYDAHNHWAEEKLRSFREDISSALTEIILEKAIVNGTCPNDWHEVLEFAQNETRAVPAVGLHPWKVNHAPEDWQQQFTTAFENGARVVGEIGLDQWIDGHDIERQQTAFRWQLAYAAHYNLPVSIHCLRAIGPLMETLRTANLPKRGIHLHAYNGPIELIEELLSYGAYFSFNAEQLKHNVNKASAVITRVPIDRVLVETDAPYLLPEPAYRIAELPDALNHPKNLLATYQTVASILKIQSDELSERVAENFHTYFLN
jgi:TatD DNase family protein